MFLDGVDEMGGWEVLWAVAEREVAWGILTLRFGR